VDELKPLLEQVDILMPNKAGAMEMTETTTPLDAAKVFLDWGIKTVVITLGNEGSMAVTNDEVIKVPGMKVKAVDTTGAGDTFCAAFDYACVIRAMNLKDASLFANAAAGLKIMKLGARTGMPTMKEVKTFLDSNKIKLQSKI
jgi:ribokinase